MFLLPLTFLPLDFFKGLINCYYRCEEDKEENRYKNRIYVVFHLDELDEIRFSKLVALNTYIKHFYMGVNNKLAVFSYAVPKVYLDDFKKIVSGKYSMTSEIYKYLVKEAFSESKEFLIRSIYTSEDTYLNLKPSRVMRENLAKILDVPVGHIQETLSKPDPQEETFKVSHLMDIKK